MSQLSVYTLDSKVLARKRKIRVRLPDVYTPEECRVLIQQDGQMAFSDRDDELPFGSWRVDSWLDGLEERGEITPVTVVAVDNSPQRRVEFAPATPEFSRYEEFVHTELLPWVKSELGIDAGPDRTALMGSSMGGLVSFALALNGPDVFSAAACLSPWFELDGFAYIHDVLRPLTEKPAPRFYIDSGIFDWRGLDDGHRGVLMARVELLRLGYADDLDWFVDLWNPSEEELDDSPVKPDKRDIARVNQHTELHWCHRLERPLKFLFENA